MDSHHHGNERIDIRADIHFHEYRNHRHRPHLEFSPVRVAPNHPPPRSTKGIKMDFQLADDMQASFAISATDEWGNPTSIGVGAPTLSGFDPAIAACTVNADNTIQVVPTGKLGATQLVVSVTAGTGTLSGTLNLTIVAGTAVNLVFVPTTSPNPVPPTPTP